MNKYENGKIYTIRCKTDDSLIYVGSTIQPLHQRWAGHKKDSKNDILPFYKNIIKWEEWYIELYENFPCENREQLNKREGEIIRLIGNLNYNIAGRNLQEYYQDNKDKLKHNISVYKNDNKEKIDKSNKEYRQKNRDIINDKKKQENICECGSSYTISHKARHLKSKRHLNFLANNKDGE